MNNKPTPSISIAGLLSILWVGQMKGGNPMNKLVALLLVLIVIIPATVLAEDKVHEFTYGSEIVFGISMDDVQAIYGKPSQYSSEELIYNDGVSFSGLSAMIDFRFNSKRLNEIVLIFNLLNGDDTEPIADFGIIDSALLQLYPDEAYVGMKSWMNKDYADKENEEQAIKDGALILMSDFKQSSIEIQHVIQFFETIPVHTVTYLPVN